MNILVINGSPRGGDSNTVKLTRAFLNGAGFTQAEIIDAAKLEIKSCLGCFACWNKTPGKCVISDDMSDVLTKLIAADVVIWSFPLYYFNVPGRLKNLIDRQLPLVLPFMEKNAETGSHPARYDLSRQRHIIISTCGFWTAQGNYDSVKAMFNHICGAGGYAAILCGQGELFSVPELKARTDKYLELVRDAGKEFAGGGISAQTLDMLAQPLYPKDVFEKMADASRGLPERDGDNSQTDDSLNFTKQMAALYKPDGAQRVLEICYTDINKTYQILLSAQGSDVITDGFKAYTTRIETPYTVWRAVARGEITGQDALFERKYKVLGDFSLMLKWDELFGEASPSKKTAAASAGKTSTFGARFASNMNVLLMPWIVIWIAVAINPIIGGAMGIAAAALVPLLWFVFCPVVYEYISVPIVAWLSLSVLLGASARIVVPVSYLSFGLIWFTGAFAKTPLTAHYSAAGYGGETALSNPLFIHTNRILTAAWGILYLITPVWTYFLMGTALSAYTGLINSLCPAAMGVFTLWFQKWYPARRARG